LLEEMAMMMMKGAGFDMAVVRQGLRDRDGKASASRKKRIKATT